MFHRLPHRGMLGLVAMSLLAGTSIGADRAYYLLDGNFTDSSGNAFHGTGVNSPTFSASPIGGQAVNLNGSNQYATLTTSGNLQLNTAAWTASAFVRPDVLGGDRTIFGHEGPHSPNISAHLVIRGTTAHFGLYGNDTPGAQAIPTNQWTHLAWVANGAQQTIYVNGRVDATSGGHATFADSGKTLQLGRWNGTNYFDGQIDEARVQNTALTGQQIRQQAGLINGIFNAANGQYYEITDFADTWANSKATAEATFFNSVQGHLAVVNDASESGFLANLGGGWSALTDDGSAGSSEAGSGPVTGWVWNTPSPQTLASTGYTNWSAGEPNNAGNEDYMEIIPFNNASAGRWNDLPNASAGLRRGLIEFDGQVATQAITVETFTGATAGDLASVAALQNFVNTSGADATGQFYAINFGDPQNRSTNSFLGDVPFAGDTAADDNLFAMRAFGFIEIPSTGPYTFGVDQDDMYQLKIDGAVVADGTCCGMELTTVNLNVGWHPFELIFGENGGGADVELFAAAGAFTEFDPLNFRLLGDTANGGLNFTAAPEPATIAMWTVFGLIGAAFGWQRLRRKK